MEKLDGRIKDGIGDGLGGGLGVLRVSGRRKPLTIDGKVSTNLL